MGGQRRQAGVLGNPAGIPQARDDSVKQTVTGTREHPALEFLTRHATPPGRLPVIDLQRLLDAPAQRVGD
jgi:hypothetical protein